MIIDSPVDYKIGAAHAKRVAIQGVFIPLVSMDDLIKMKEGTNRQQDDADIRYLKELKDE